MLGCAVSASAPVNGRLKLGERVGKHEGAGGQAQSFCSQAANAFAVHGQPRGTGGGNDAHDTGGLQFFEHAGGDGLDLGHHDGGPFGLDQGFELRGVAHQNGTRVVGHLLAGRVVVTVDGHGFHAQALQRDQHFFAQFAAAEQHDFGGAGR